MSLSSRTFAFIAAAALPLACSTTPAPDSPGSYPERIYDGVDGVYVPDKGRARLSSLPWANEMRYSAGGPFAVSMDAVKPSGKAGADSGWLLKGPKIGSIESPISDARKEQLRAEALNLAPSLNVQDGLAFPGLDGPTASTAFDSLDANDCCGGGLNVPPDPELAVGPNHIIAVVNVAFAIYDKTGTILEGPTTFDDFFSGVPGCNGTFDPNVIYDEEHDRFVMAIDANGTDYCIAATTGSNPTGSWNQYIIATDVGGNFFDYPHAGVGLDAIYMGANMFAGNSFGEGRVWAIDKFAMYSGGSVSVVTRSLGADGTPQPMNLHGWAQGTWPTGGPHYILTDGPSFNGEDYGVWSWNDPFGANTFTNEGTVDLNAASGVTAGFPIAADQAGSNINLDTGDWRVLDAEYRNGYIWMANTIACNPGGGTVNCVRWAQVDPTGPSVVDAGVLGSSGESRFHPDLAADDCNNMAIGYTKSSGSSFPSVYVAGRESTDTAGTLQAEQLVKAGERDYDSFQSGTTHRWGDYTGMTIDPDGTTFWYLGEYSKDISNFDTTTWGNYISSFSFESCDGGPTDPPGAASNPNPGVGVSNVSIEANLSWTAGAGATSHDVYFGTQGGGLVFQGNQGGTSFDPGTLAYSTTYVWRIDEVNSVGTTSGPSNWSFTTEDEPVPDPTMHLANLSGSASAGGSGGKWNATVQITVEDEGGSPLGGVLAEGNWSNGANGSSSCTTNGSGQCSVSRNNIKRNTSSVTFTLSNLSAAGYDYEPADNEVSTVIVVSQSSQDQQPNASNDSYSTTEGVVLSGVNVLDNDDLGDEPTTVTSFDATGSNGGSVSITAGGALTYTPAATGQDSFGYTITDSDGDSDSATVTVTVNPDGGGGYQLSASGYKVRGVHTVDLDWSGFAANVSVTRDGSQITTGGPSGSYTDSTGNKGGATYQYEVCEQGTSNCAQASVTF